MPYPKNLGDKQIYREDFTSPQLATDNGLVLYTNAYIDSGKLFLDGVLDYASVPDKNLNMGNDSFTVRVRAAIVNNASTDVIVGKRESFSTVPGWYIFIDSAGVVRFTVSDGTNTAASSATGAYTVDGTMAEIVLSYDTNGNAQIFVNGAVTSAAVSAAAIGNINTTTPFYFGVTGTISNPAEGSFDSIEIYRGTAWTLDEALDAYEKDTYPELDASVMDVSLPLRSHYLGDTGASSVLVDGDMEASGVTAWTVGSSAVLTKETTSPAEGTQWLKIAYGGTANYFAYQSVTTVNVTYRITGWAKGDGTQVPSIQDPSGGGATTPIWTGTSSTDWQEIDITYKFLGGLVYLRGLAASAGFIGFDDISIVPLTDQTENLGTASNATLGTTAGVGHPVQINPHGLAVDTTEYFTVPDVVMTSSKTWSIGYLTNIKDIITVTTHFGPRLGTYQSDGFLINQFGAALSFYWNSAGPSWNTLSTFFKDGVHSVILTSLNGVVTAYMDGVAQGSTDLSAKAAFNGTYPLLFGNTSSSMEADVYNVEFSGCCAWTPRQVRNLHERFLSEINL